MDYDPELDLTQISGDKIRQFLSCKLEQGQLENRALEAMIAEREKATTSTEAVPGIQLVRHWTRILNNKYCLGYELSCSETTNLDLVLSEASGESLLYKVQTFSVSDACNDADSYCDLFKKFQDHKGKLFVVVSIEMPQFVQKLKYDIYSHLMCNDAFLALPSIEIVQFSKASGLEEHCLETFLTIVACSELNEVVLCLPQESSVSSTLENNCSLTRRPLMHKSYFLALNVSESVNNTMLIPDKSQKNNAFIKVYTSNDNQLFAFLHHLLKTIPSSHILPQSLHENFNHHEDTLAQLRVAMRLDLEQSYATLSKLTTGSDKFETQRTKLSKQEGETDLKYLRVLKM